jgi:Fe-Mn family superoxide dismutase
VLALSSSKLPPFLAVWEHAYYVDFQNRRPDFIANFFDLIDWAKVAERYAAAKK